MNSKIAEGAASTGAISPMGSIVVTDELPVGYPIKELGQEFVKRRDNPPKLFRNVFVSHSYDGYLPLNGAMSEPLKMVMPGTLKFRSAQLDALENTRVVVGTYALYMMSSPDRKAAWTIAPECRRMSSRAYEL